VNGIIRISESIGLDLMRRLPDQRKTQRGKLALRVATMLNTRRANIIDIAASLPIEADRTDMRYQWIMRLLANPLLITKDVMEPFAREVLDHRAGQICLNSWPRFLDGFPASCRCAIAWPSLQSGYALPAGRPGNGGEIHAAVACG
jgi:hypothetical protein